MNHIKVCSVHEAIDISLMVFEMLDMVANVIQQKIKNKDAPIIITDKSTIAID